MRRSFIFIFIVLLFSIDALSQKETVALFPLSSVRLLDGPFYNAQQVDLKYILELDEDRLLAPYLREVGLKPKKESYANWENIGLDGHTAGHYLTAVAQMYAVTGNAEVKKRMDYMVDQLAICQKKSGIGYVGGVPEGMQLWADIKNGKISSDNFSLNNRWVPLYNLHKLYAGLRDAYQIGGNEQARVVFVTLCDWMINLMSGLSDTQIQSILREEQGGINEVFADAAQMTGDQKYLVMARRLSHRKILNPLLHRKDSLTGLHANTQIPKVVGFKRISDVSHDTAWSNAADFFWETVVHNRSASIGGNSVREHFQPSEDFSSMIESNQGPETCNTYNMMRLTKALFLTNPKAAYMDYYERSVYNNILSSQHPVHGGFVYFTPMRPRHYRVYSNPQETFWCCVGTGLENHGKYGELIYARSKNDLYVNLFIPSTLTWKEKGLTVTQKTDFPYSESTSLSLQLQKPSTFRIKIRYPAWVNKGAMTIQVNGKAFSVIASASSYATIDRSWKSGDIITVNIPMHTTVEFLPDGSSWGSFLHGPIVLGAATDSTDLAGLIADGSRMGHVANDKYYPIDEAPVIVKTNDNFISEIKPVQGQSMAFTASTLISPMRYSNVKLVPFFTIHDKRYMLYWQIASKEKLVEINASIKQRERDLLELENRTIDRVVLGEQQPEVEHHFEGEGTETGSVNAKAWRSTTAWFSYDFQNRGKKGEVIRIDYSGEGWNRGYDLLVNGKLVKSISVPNNLPHESLFIEYEIPADIINSQTGEATRVKLQAKEKNHTGRIFEIRLLKKN